jgi:hypothetical protein
MHGQSEKPERKRCPKPCPSWESLSIRWFHSAGWMRRMEPGRIFSIVIPRFRGERSTLFGGQVGDKNARNADVRFSFLPKLVPGAGIEPARPQGARDFKSLVSTNSTTQALEGLRASITNGKTVTSKMRPRFYLTTSERFYYRICPPKEYWFRKASFVKR